MKLYAELWIVLLGVIIASLMFIGAAWLKARYGVM